MLNNDLKNLSVLWGMVMACLFLVIPKLACSFCQLPDFEAKHSFVKNNQ